MEKDMDAENYDLVNQSYKTSYLVNSTGSAKTAGKGQPELMEEKFEFSAHNPLDNKIGYQQLPHKPEKTPQSKFRDQLNWQGFPGQGHYPNDVDMEMDSPATAPPIYTNSKANQDVKQNVFQYQSRSDELHSRGVSDQGGSGYRALAHSAGAQEQKPLPCTQDELNTNQDQVDKQPSQSIESGYLGSPRYHTVMTGPSDMQGVCDAPQEQPGLDPQHQTLSTDKSQTPPVQEGQETPLTGVVKQALNANQRESQPTSAQQPRTINQHQQLAMSTLQRLVHIVRQYDAHCSQDNAQPNACASQDTPSLSHMLADYCKMSDRAPRAHDVSAARHNTVFDIEHQHARRITDTLQHGDDDFGLASFVDGTMQAGEGKGQHKGAAPAHHKGVVNEQGDNVVPVRATSAIGLGVVCSERHVQAPRAGCSTGALPHDDDVASQRANNVVIQQLQRELLESLQRQLEDAQSRQNQEEIDNLKSRIKGLQQDMRRLSKFIEETNNTSEFGLAEMQGECVGAGTNASLGHNASNKQLLNENGDLRRSSDCTNGLKNKDPGAMNVHDEQSSAQVNVSHDVGSAVKCQAQKDFIDPKSPNNNMAISPTNLAKNHGNFHVTPSNMQIPLRRTSSGLSDDQGEQSALCEFLELERIQTKAELHDLQERYNLIELDLKNINGVYEDVNQRYQNQKDENQTLQAKLSKLQAEYNSLQKKYIGLQRAYKCSMEKQGQQVTEHQ